MNHCYRVLITFGHFFDFKKRIIKKTKQKTQLMSLRFLGNNKYI